METVDWHGFRAVEDNQPLARPGLYLLEHLASGMIYVGISHDIAMRIQQHGRSGKSLIAKAIRRHGKAAFLATPVFYGIYDARGLPEIERLWIECLDTVATGFNVHSASQGAGPYGPAHRAAMLTRCQTASYKESLIKRSANGTWTANRSASMLAACGRPEVKTNFSNAMLKKWQNPAFRETMSKRDRSHLDDPELHKRRGESIKLAYTKPEVRAKLMARPQSSIGHIWVTDGISSKPIPPGQEIPDGWRRGVPPRNTAAQRGRRWVTDGQSSRRIMLDTPIPDGWRPGQTSIKKKII